MYNRVFKNYQVNMGVPFQVKTPVSFETIKKADVHENQEAREQVYLPEEDIKELLEKAREEAQMIVKEAEYEALRILQDTERETEAYKAKVEEEARLRGYEEGFSEAKKQYEDLIQEAEFVREHARVEYKEVLESIESDAVNIVLDIARKVIGNELSQNRESVLYLVKQAFEKCANKENMTLRVAPEEYEFLVEAKDRLVSMVEGIGDLEIKRDASLKGGACVVETAFGSVDASVQTRMKKIEDAFRQVIGK